MTPPWQPTQIAWTLSLCSTSKNLLTLIPSVRYTVAVKTIALKLKTSDCSKPLRIENLRWLKANQLKQKRARINERERIPVGLPSGVLALKALLAIKSKLMHCWISRRHASVTPAIKHLTDQFRLNTTKQSILCLNFPYTPLLFSWSATNTLF